MIYCSSISALLYIASCELLVKEPLTFVRYANTDPSYYDSEQEKIISEWIKFICKEAGIRLEGFYELKSIFRSSVKEVPAQFVIWSNELIELPRWAVHNGDTLDDGLLSLWLTITKGKKLNVVGHGVGGILNMIPALSGNVFINHLRAIRNTFIRHKIDRLFFFNGMNQELAKFLPWYLARKVQFIDVQSVNRFCLQLADKLIERYPILSEVSKLNKRITIYAPTGEVKDIDYFSYLQKQIQYFPFAHDTVFVIKNHPSDPRDYGPYFDLLGLKTITLSSLEWRWFPLEIILNVNPDCQYLGAYSGAMLTIDRSRRSVYMPAKDEVVNFYHREYSALINSLR